MQRRAALDYFDVPTLFEWLWIEFCSMPRSGAAFDRMHLTGQDIEFWERRTGIRFSLYETELLLNLDAARPKNALDEGDD